MWTVQESKLKVSDVYDANTRLISYQGSPHCENNNIDISQTYQQQTTHEQIERKSKLAVKVADG